MKGQMYIILAILVITALILLRISMNLNSILESNTDLQSNLDSLELQNIEKGIKQSLASSYFLSNASDNVNYFIEFARSAEGSRGNTLGGISMQSSYPNVTSGNITMNTSVHNFLGFNISNLTLYWSGDGSSQSFSNVADNATQAMVFNFTAGNASYTLSLNYTVSGSTTIRNITVPINVSMSRFVGYYKVALSTPQSSPTDEFTSTVVLNQTQYT